MSTEELNNATKDLSLEDKETTVLESKEEFTVKHPLNSKWTLWYTKPPIDKDEAWNDLLKEIVTFDTVEEFWGIFHAIPKVTELPLKSDYHLFRNGIKPEWEDEQNANGGKWNFKFNMKFDGINDVWTRALLSVIGETIEDDENEVNGIVFNVRRGTWRIGLWTRTCNKETLQSIGERFRKVLNLADDEHVEFFPHKDSSRKPEPTIVV
ncbi:translation initiation factor eIF4E [Martiniozyma asiatica (nom. inval.)]|nr:translation initiation factor eIF4E [Martiniozyma asiatica]